ncbi:MAG: glycosyltransferase family 2 protein [Candidatus Omnitrophota bacterium]
MKLSIVVPCYNEARNIPLILERFARAAEGYPFELVLVDNGSQDGSEKVLTALLPRYLFARSVRVHVNQGYGFGILQGLKAATGDYLGWTHADMQTDPADCFKAMDIMARAGYPGDFLIKGSRRGRPWTDEIFTWGMGVFETFFFGCFLWDINAQPNIFHRSFYAAWQDAPHDFALDLYVFCRARACRMKVVRFPVVFPGRVHGVSSWNTGLASKWKFICRTLSYSITLRKRIIA